VIQRSAVFLLWRRKSMRGMVRGMRTQPNAHWHVESQPLVAPRGVAAVVAGSLASLVLMALLLLARRVSGGISADLPVGTLAATALAALVIVIGTRMLWRRTFLEGTSLDVWLGWGGSAAIVLLAIGVSFPARRIEDWIVWLPVLVIDQFVRRRTFESRDNTEHESKIAKPQAILRAEEVQHFLRSRDASGAETVRGTLRADFVPQQRTATVYVGFCPPLAGRPELTVELATGPAAEFKIVQAFPHGARIDVRLASTATQAMCVILNVTAKAPQRDAVG
jgi:hypothetical protein